MNLSDKLISQFAKATKVEKTKRESIVYGTIVEKDGSKYLKIDGSNILTPIVTTVNMTDGERVTAMIKNHSAVVTGNITSPAIRNKDVDSTINNKVNAYIGQNEDGIIFGDLSSEDLLYNLLISLTGICVRNGSINLAKFADDILELGNDKTDVNIYGRSIYNYVGSANAVYKPYYEAGDSLPVKWYGSGFVSASSKNVYFSIPLAKPVIGNPTVSVAFSSGLKIRQNSKYTHGSSSSTYTSPSSYSAELSSDGGMINIVASFTDTTNAVNDSPCGIAASINIEFSATQQ